MQYDHLAQYLSCYTQYEMTLALMLQTYNLNLRYYLFSYENEFFDSKYDHLSVKYTLKYHSIKGMRYLLKSSTLILVKSHHTAAVNTPALSYFHLKIIQWAKCKLQTKHLLISCKLSIFRKQFHYQRECNVYITSQKPAPYTM